jgi:adenylate cyclase
MNPVIEIIKESREQAIHDLVAALIEVIPKYAHADSAELRANCTMLYDEFLKLLETGQTDRYTERLQAVADLRLSQGFSPADFARALLMTYPIVRTVVRKRGPRNDALFAKAFEEVEHALFRMLGMAASIFSAGLARQAEARAGQLEVQNTDLRERARDLSARNADQRERLHAAEELNARVIASLSSGVAVIEDYTQIVQLWSARLADITGISERVALGRPLDEVVKPLGVLPYRELLDTVRATDHLPMTKVQLKLPGGVTRAVFVRGERLRQPDRQSIAGTVVIIDDVTERELLIDSFSRYVSKEVVQRILSRSGRGQKLEGERRACSILFADIRGFTGISERVTPESLHELLNHYFRVMIEQVSAHDGIIDKFIGDKIMAVFTGTEREGAAAAVRAASAIQAEIAKLNRQRQTEGAEPISVGIGVNTGTVVMGTVGSEERMSFTVIGDAVNVADRLQSMAPPSETLVGGHTHELVKDLFVLEGLGAQPIKGRTNPEEMFKLRGEKR